LTEAAKFEHVSDAVTQANTIQSFNAGLILVGLLCIYLLVSATAIQRAYIHILPYGGLIWTISWFFRFRGLESKDPDFGPARAGMKRSLLMWSIGSLVYSVCLISALLIFGGQQSLR
jgi:hypothetical protein